MTSKSLFWTSQPDGYLDPIGQISPHTIVSDIDSKLATGEDVIKATPIGIAEINIGKEHKGENVTIIEPNDEGEDSRKSRTPKTIIELFRENIPFYENNLALLVKKPIKVFESMI